MFIEILEKLKENKLIVTLSGAVVSLLLLVCLLVFRPQTEDSVLSDASTFSSTQTTSSTSTTLVSSSSKTESSEQPAGKITVDIKGAVQNEGVYTVVSGSRVYDVVKKAGGFTENADKKSVNLAQKVEDEGIIYVAAVGENISVVDTAASTSTSDSSTTSQMKSTDKINLNTATLADLQTISGIGEKRAQDIIDYRDSNGGFSSVDDLKNISGIGDKTFEKLKDAVTVD